MEVFISYSHKDQVWKERVVTFMQCMKQQGLLDYSTWDDDELMLGEAWKIQIISAIKKAKIAILLISPDFIASDFINSDEVPELLKYKKSQELTIVPVIIRPCPWEVVDWLSSIQLHPSDGKALSGCSDYEVENNLKQLSLEVNRLLSQMRDEDGALDKLFVEKSEFHFLDELGVKKYIYDLTKHESHEALLIFKTKKQGTWLVTNNGFLYCVLDSEDTRNSDRLLQWKMKLLTSLNVSVREKEGSAPVGLVDIGKRQNWLYSTNLHPNITKLRDAIVNMIENAIHS